MGLGHLAQVVGVVTIGRGELWVRSGDDKLSRCSQHIRNAAYSVELRLMVDMFDHFETGHQIKRSRRKPKPQISALFKAQLGTAMCLPGPVNRLRGNVHADHRRRNLSKHGCAIARTTPKIKNLCALSQLHCQTVSRQVLVLCQFPVRSWNVAFMHEPLEVAAARLGNNAQKAAQFIIARKLLVVEAGCRTERQLNDAADSNVLKQQTAQQHFQ